MMRIGRRTALFCFAGGLLSPAAWNVAYGRARDRRGEGNNVKLELHLPRTKFLAGEKISVDVRLTNTSSAPVQVANLDSRTNPQPTYTLKSSAHSEAISFSAHPASETNANVELRSLAPGDYLETGFYLNNRTPVTSPGKYVLSARIEGVGWEAAAEPVSFTVEKAFYQSAGMGLDLACSTTRKLRVPWLSRGADGQTLGETFFYEKRPDLGEINVTGSRIIRTVAAQATDPFCPWTNFDRASILPSWDGWREASRIFAVESSRAEPQSFDAGSETIRLIRPALMLQNGELDVFLLSEEAGAVRAARFVSHRKGVAKAPELAWSVAIPGVVSARAIIAPASAGGARKLCAIANEHGSVAIHLLDIQDNSAQLAAPIQIDNAIAVAAYEPGLTVAANGAVRFSVIVRTKDPDGRIDIVDGIVPASGQPNVQRSTIAQREQGVTAATIAYTATETSSPVRVWAIRLHDGTVHFASPNAHPVESGSNLPISLLRMSGATYFLTLNPETGPAFLPVAH